MFRNYLMRQTCMTCNRTLATGPPRWASTPPHSTKSPSMNTEDSKKWIPIYKFPLIGGFSAASKLKMYQAQLTAVGIPVTMVLETWNFLPATTMYALAGVGITGTLTLGAFSWLTTNLIGFLYVDPEMKLFRLSYLDFWGNRKNIETEIANVCPLYDEAAPKLPFYMNVRLTSDKRKFRLLHRTGGILDYEKLAEVLGEPID